MSYLPEKHWLSDCPTEKYWLIDCPLENKHIFDFLPTDYWVIIPPVDAAKGEFENGIVRIIEMKMVYLELLKLMLLKLLMKMIYVGLLKSMLY